MKTYQKRVIFKLTLLIVSQSFFASFSQAAKLEYMEQQESIHYSPLETSIQKWDELSPSFFRGSDEGNKQADYQSVITLIKQKQYKQASNKTTSLLEQSPNDPQLYNFQALLHIIEGNKEAAKQSYNKAIKLDSNNSHAYLGLANLAIADDQPNKAKEYINKVQTINDKYPESYLMLANITYKEGDIQEAEQILLTGYKKVQGNVSAEIQIITILSKFYLLQKQPQKILPLAQELVDRYPDNNKALNAFAAAQIINNKISLAEQTLEKIIEQDTKDAKHRIVLANLLSQQPGREKETLKLLDEAFAINPANPHALILKTSYLAKLQKYQQALDSANKLDTLFPTLIIGKQLKGNIYLAEKKFDQALHAYQQVYQIKPKIKLLLTIANLMLAMDKQDDAIKLLKQETEKYDNNKVINLTLASIFQQQGNYTQAEKYYRAVLTEQPDNVIALNNLAWVYTQQNNPEAIKLAKQAYNIAPKSAAIGDTYGYLLIQQTDKVDEGLKILQEAAKAAPQEGDIQFHLAKAYSLSGDKQKAIGILETLNKQTTTFPEKENARKLLIKLKAK